MSFLRILRWIFQVVDLSFNYIKNVDAVTFAGLESLQHINLESNQVSVGH